VPNPAVVTTTDAERRCLTPAGLQDKIDALVKNAGAGAGAAANRRSFVRPSGTEPVVRVYAEASSQAEADALAEAVKAVVSEVCGKAAK
jgi:phosphoacetylglucosamine mutase